MANFNYKKWVLENKYRAENPFDKEKEEDPKNPLGLSGMEEEVTDKEEDKLKKIEKELNKASKMHKGQADRINKIVNEQDDDPNWQKRQDRLTPGKNPEEFYGSNKSQESMSNADIRALQTVVGEYSLNKVLNTIAVITDKIGKHDEADMIQKLASQIQDFEGEEFSNLQEDKDSRSSLYKKIEKSINKN